jgi:hypothetical protein
MGIDKSAGVLATETRQAAAGSLTALGNLHFPPVAAPEPDVLDENQRLDLSNLGDGSVVLLKLRDGYQQCASRHG